MDLRTGTAVQLLAGAVTVLPVALLTEHGLPLPSTGSGWAALVWIIVVNSIAAAILLFVLLRRGTGAGASGLLYLVPAVTAVLAVPVLGQPLELATIVGLALTLAGVVLVNRAAQPAAVDSVSTSAGVSSSSSTGNRPASCSGVRALAMGDATVGAAASQANATAAWGTSWAAATSSSAASTRSPRSSR